eukprot:SAG11_NODE_1778_length_4265_cov_1.686750_3_plen_136_part_00
MYEGAPEPQIQTRIGQLTWFFNGELIEKLALFFGPPSVAAAVKFSALVQTALSLAHSAGAGCAPGLGGDSLSAEFGAEVRLGAAGGGAEAAPLLAALDAAIEEAEHRRAAVLARLDAEMAHALAARGQLRRLLGA